MNNLKLKKIISAASASAQRPYDSYTAIISQSGVAAPTAKELENDLGQVTFSRLAAGEYLGYCSGAFPEHDKVAFFIGSHGISTHYAAWRIDTNTFKIQSYTQILSKTGEVFNGTLQYLNLDNLLAETVIEIRRYK